MTWQDFIHLTDTYGPIATTVIVITIIVMLIHRAWPTINKTVTVINEIAELPQTIATIESEIKTIKSEVLPNGGGSLRDAVNRTEDQIKKIVMIVSKHEEEIHQLQDS